MPTEALLVNKSVSRNPVKSECRIMKRLLLVFGMIAASVIPCAAQIVTRIEAQPEQLQMRAGESADLVVVAFDQDGRAISTPLRIS